MRDLVRADLAFMTIALIRAACVAPLLLGVLRYERAALVAVFPLCFTNNLFTHPEIMIFVLLCVAALSQATREGTFQ